MADPAPQQQPGFFGLILTDMAWTLAQLPAAEIGTLQTFVFGGIGEALRPIIRQEIQDAFKTFKDSSEVGGRNEALHNEWISDAGPAH